MCITNIRHCIGNMISNVLSCVRQAKCRLEKNELTMKIDQCEKSVKTISGGLTVMWCYYLVVICFTEQMRQLQDQMKSQRNAEYEQQQKDDKRSPFPLHHEEGASAMGCDC